MAQTETATLGGGCFWCVEAVYQRVKGIESVTPGYAGGSTKNPTYKDVSSGKTSHLEAVQIQYDPKKVDYKTLVDIFWRSRVEDASRVSEFQSSRK